MSKLFSPRPFAHSVHLVTGGRLRHRPATVVAQGVGLCEVTVAGLVSMPIPPSRRYTGVNRVVIRTSAGFARYGDGELSRQPVAVSWSETDGAVYVEDETPTIL